MQVETLFLLYSLVNSTKIDVVNVDENSQFHLVLVLISIIRNIYCWFTFCFFIGFTTKHLDDLNISFSFTFL